MNNKILSKRLNDIAEGSNFSGNSLYEAFDHAATTRNDRQMLMRYMYGSELISDKIRLQELANYILENETN